MKKPIPVDWDALDDRPPAPVPGSTPTTTSTTRSTTLSLPGLDAQNPLAFLAALGLLRVVDDAQALAGVGPPKLSFAEEGRQVPRLETVYGMEEIVRLVLADAAAQGENLALRLAYDDDGNLVPPGTGGATRDLKPSPTLARACMESASTSGRRTADLAAAFFSEMVQDNNGNTKPTAFHFTAGQQAFLEMVDELRTSISAEDVIEALTGPWRNESPLPSLSWDASVSRNYALRASNPSKEKRGSVPAANWLGVVGLGFFPVHVRRSRLETTCVQGGWKDSVLTWPLWGAPATASTAAGLLRTARRWSARERAAIGITAVLSSRILRSDQGGYGSFCPAEVVLPP